MFDLNKMPDAPWEYLPAFAERVKATEKMSTLREMCRNGEIATLPRKNHKEQFRVNLVLEYKKCAERDY
jgi:hypothetical protein